MLKHSVFFRSGHYNVNRPYVVNGLNQLTTSGTTALGYDGRGNLTASGGNTYSYTGENRLSNVPSSNIALAYEPGGGQLLQIWAGSGKDQRFGWSGGHMLTEIDAANGWPITRRYVYGPGDDTPLVWYEGAGLTDRRWLHADERGSIVAVSDASGAAIAVNRYDGVEDVGERQQYGIPVRAQSILSSGRR